MYLGTTSSLSDLLSMCCSSWIKVLESCCYIKSTNSNTTFYQGSNSWLLCVNSTYESTFSTWWSTLLKFCCKLLVRLCALLVCTSCGVINVACNVLWPAGLSSIHRNLCSIWETFHVFQIVDLLDLHSFYY
jgi:hypothetical protein